MDELTDKQKKKLVRLVRVTEEEELGIVEELNELEERLDGVEEKVSSIKDGEDGEDGKDGLPGEKGEKGDKGEPGKDGINGLNGVDGKDGKDGSEIEPLDIVSKLQSLEGDERLDASAIKNLPKGTSGVTVGGNRPVKVFNNGTEVSGAVTEFNFVNPTSITTTGVSQRRVNITTGGGSGHTIEDEGTPLTTRTKLNFVGAGVAVTDDSGDDATVVTISGGGSGTPGGSDTQVQFNDSSSFGGDAGMTYNKTYDSLYVGSVASILPGTVTRSSGYISSIALTGGRTVTVTRSGNYVSSITDGNKTWTFTRDGDNRISSWSVA